MRHSMNQSYQSLGEYGEYGKFGEYGEFGDVRTTREFNFPSSALVDEYIDELISHGRLVRLNHTELWQSRSDDGMDGEDGEEDEMDEMERVGDDLLTPSADARRLYENYERFQNLDYLERRRNGANGANGGNGPGRNDNVAPGGNGGLGNMGNSGGPIESEYSDSSQISGGGITRFPLSWLLRRGFGLNGGSLGEKLGETIETAAYKAVCSAVMSVLARILSALHGVNVMAHSDIRLYIERDADLPPVGNKFGPFGQLNGENYAQEAIKSAIRKGAKKKKKGGKSHHHHSSHLSHSSQSSHHHPHHHHHSDETFLQRDAVVETLISHCQISAPLLKLFPLDWQRAMVGNVITLATSLVSDFADGIQVQILGHSLSFSFKPITEADMTQHMGAFGTFGGLGGLQHRRNHRRANPHRFEAAVQATARDIAQNLTFLDGWLEWLERKVGGGILRAQIANLISRVVLTLIDEVLSGARLDLWSSQANGPRLYAALEYRTDGRKGLDGMDGADGMDGMDGMGGLEGEKFGEM